MSHEEIYNRYNSEDITQTELADEYGLAQSTVSSIIRRFDRANQTGEQDDIFDTSSFLRDDETETHDDDTYYCAECEADLQYMQPECPNCGEPMNWDAV